MTVVSITQDTRGGGGNATVVGWYRRWAEVHEPARVECFLDESSKGWPIWARREWGAGRVAVPRALPKLHVPPYLCGRLHLRKLWKDVEEVHVVGAVALHGWLAGPEVPPVVWFATTIEDERRSILRLTDPPRQVLYRFTLPALRRTERAVFRHARRVLAMSPHTADLLIRGGVPADRVEVRPVPVDTRRFDSSPSAERRGLLFAGRADDKRKGVDRAIALVEQSTRARRTGLDIVSTLPPPAGLVRKLNGVVRWHGEMDEIADAYRRAQLLVFPSRQEGLGIVAFEALACETPVVAYRCGGPDAFLAESGGAVLVDNQADFQAAVERLLADEDRCAEMGALGREWVSKNLSAESFLGDPGIFRP